MQQRGGEFAAVVQHAGKNEFLLVAGASFPGVIGNGLRDPPWQWTHARMREKHFAVRDGKFALAQFLIRKDFRQGHEKTLCTGPPTASVIVRALEAAVIDALKSLKPLDVKLDDEI